MPLSDPEYLRRETWSLIEAACLLADTDPVAPDQFDRNPSTGGRPAHYYSNLKDATDAGILGCFESRTGRIAERRVPPWEVVKWARARGDNVPEQLRDVPEPTPAAQTAEATPAEKPITLTERNTLLVIIAALCKPCKIKYEERGAPVDIARLTEQLGAPVSDDTVRRVLARITDAVEARSKG